MNGSSPLFSTIMKVGDMTLSYHLCNIAISLLSLVVLGLIVVSFPISQFALITAFFLNMGWMVIAGYNLQFVVDRAVQASFTWLLKDRP